MTEIDLQSRVREYLEAFDGRNLDKCLDLYADDAVLNFQNSVYAGRESITDWHRERFEADLRLVRLDNIFTDGETVTLEGVATSNRLRAWKIKSVNGVMTVRFAGDKIQELSFGVKFDLW